MKTILDSGRLSFAEKAQATRAHMARCASRLRSHPILTLNSDSYYNLKVSTRNLLARSVDSSYCISLR